MWYKTKTMVFYIASNDVVWRVWQDGIASETDMEADAVANICDPIDKPLESWADIALRTINRRLAFSN